MKRATRENIEKIRETARRATKKQGQTSGFYTIAGACTVYAGTEEERTFTEAQLKELFKAVME